MKTLSILLFWAAIAHAAQAQDTIVCSLTDSNNRSNLTTVIADLNHLEDEGLYSSDGIDIGDDNYSFDLSITNEGRGSILVDVIFYENNNVQDEVASSSWEIKQKGLLVIQEHLNDDSDKTIMNFHCDYN
jgi:hypothetical protein